MNMNEEKASEIYYWIKRQIEVHNGKITETYLLTLASKQGYASYQVREVLYEALNIGRLFQPSPNQFAYVKAYG